MTSSPFPTVIQNLGDKPFMLVDLEKPPHPLSPFPHLHKPFNREVARLLTSIPSSLSPLEQFLRTTMLSLGITFGPVNFWRCTAQAKLSNYREKSCQIIFSPTSKPKSGPSAQYGARSQVDSNPLIRPPTPQEAEKRCPSLLCGLRGGRGKLKWSGKIVG